MDDKISNQYLQDCIIYLLINSSNFIKLVFGILKPEHLGTEVLRNLTELCLNYFSVFKQSPKNHFQIEVDNFLKNKKDAEKDMYYIYLKKIEKLSEPNEDYIISLVSKFIRSVEIETSIIEAAKLISQNKIEEAELVFDNAKKSGIKQQEVGIDYDYLETSGIDQLLGEMLMKTGVEHLNTIIGGYKRKSLLCFLGGYKGKKSWALIHLARQAKLTGLNVLYISHELTELQIIRRIDMAFGGLVNLFDWDDIKNNVQKKSVKVTEYDSNANTGKIVKVVRNTILNKDAVLKARKLSRKFGGSIKIKKYPMGRCTIREIERYLNYLENYEGFVPDVLINDYPEIMCPLDDKKDKRNQIDDIYVAMKGLADERNIMVATVSQARRESLMKHKVTMKDFAEDIRKAGNIDLGIAICQTEEQILRDEGFLYVIAGRDVPMGIGCFFQMNISIGQFCSFSWKPKKITNINV